MAHDPDRSLLNADGTVSRRKLLGRAAMLGGGALALTASGGLLAACGDDDGETTARGQGGGGGETPSGPFRLGWIRPTTGLYASGFAPIYVSGLIAVDEINAAGGIMGREIERAEFDDEGDPSREPAIIQRLLSEDLGFCLGPTGASQVTASIEAARREKIVQCAWTNDHRLLLGGEYPFHYGLSWNTLQSSEIAATYMVESRGLSRFGILQEETAFGEIATETTNDALRELGVEGAAVEVYPIDAPDMSTYVRNIANNDIEGLFYWGSVLQNTVQVFAAMDQQNVRLPIVGQAAMQWQEIVETAPLAIIEDVWTVGLKAYTWSGNENPTERRAAYAEKVASYEETQAGPQISANSPYYDFPHLLKAVIEEEQSFDVEVVQRALDNVKDFDGMIGNITLTPDDHGGLSIDDLALLNVASGRDTERAIGGVFRERADL